MAEPAIQAASAPPKVVCRHIVDGDLPALATLLTLGFPDRDAAYWLAGFARLARHVPPDGYPRFGHMLEAEGRPVGVHLLICSAQPGGVRCNVSSWFVHEAFRSFGAMLLLRATRQLPGAYVNLHPKLETVRIIEALGWRKISQGAFAAAPLLAVPRGRVRLRRWDQAELPAAERRRLEDHAGFGCIGLWCDTSDGGQPIILRRRRLRSGLPCAQMIHYRSLETVEQAAAALGRFLGARGMPLMLVPAHRPLRGVPGRFFPEKLPIYCKGEPAPQPGDLAYTEAAIFGM